MIDCHCHILPGVDDGARDLQTAHDMGRVAVASGISTVICTPHHMNGVFNNSRERILLAVDALSKSFAQEHLELKLAPGSEVHLTADTANQLSLKQAMTFGDQGSAALIELPKQTLPAGATAMLDDILARGVVPVIAHPERNAELASHPSKLLEWTSMGCGVQLTAQSVCGDFGAAIQKVCHFWLQRACVHVIASDAHRPRGRKPDLRKAADYVTKHYGEQITMTLFHDNPSRLLSGAELLPQPSPTIARPPVLSKIAKWLKK